MTKDWRRESLTWGKRLTLVIVIMVAALYGIVGLAQRSPEALRKGLEDYLSKVTGHVGEITELREARLMPTVLFKMTGVNIRDVKDPKKIYIHTDSAYVATPFWRTVFGAGGFSALEVKGLEVATGYFLPQKLTVDFAGISDPDPASNPQVVVEGRYNKQPLLVTMEMRRKTGRRGVVYVFGDNSMTTFKIGGTEGEGITARHFTSVSLESARLEKDGMAAEFTADNIYSNPVDVAIKGTIGDIPFNAALTGSGENITLKIVPETPDPAGLEKIKRFTDAVKEDLGISGADSKVRIEIAGAPETETTKAETADQKTVKDSE